MVVMTGWQGLPVAPIAGEEWVRRLRELALAREWSGGDDGDDDPTYDAEDDDGMEGRAVTVAGERVGAVVCEVREGRDCHIARGRIESGGDDDGDGDAGDEAGMEGETATIAGERVGGCYGLLVAPMAGEEWVRGLTELALTREWRGGDDGDDDSTYGAEDDDGMEGRAATVAGERAGAVVCEVREGRDCHVARGRIESGGDDDGDGDAGDAAARRRR
ncbi:hypothetical protein Cgig2_021948 [Carnegiea gigantea]|uniref:Uncharacterized protein n=1 Tax=Carnegiea gigantea TaxID=171969 RepID=A0A9Q1QQ74_9CARY|nr:hypothetical protein Cgig2_021948 [Carnegiea gigantea]